MVRLCERRRNLLLRRIRRASIFPRLRDGSLCREEWAVALLCNGQTRLKTHIPVGVNAGLSGIPYWGTDIGGFVPTPDFTGELYVRWFQFSAFCPLFRSHGRNWRLRLPWGWNTGGFGFQETAGYQPDPAELHNAAIEPSGMNTRGK